MSDETPTVREEAPWDRTLVLRVIEEQHATTRMLSDKLDVLTEAVQQGGQRAIAPWARLVYILVAIVLARETGMIQALAGWVAPDIEVSTPIGPVDLTDQ